MKRQREFLKGRGFLRSSKKFSSEKDLRLFVKKLFQEKIKGLPPQARIEIHVLSLKPPMIRLKLPFFSEGNLLRANEVDFFLEELYNWGIEGDIFYLDDQGEEVVG